MVLVGDHFKARKPKHVAATRFVTLWCKPIAGSAWQIAQNSKGKQDDKSPP